MKTKPIGFVHLLHAGDENKREFGKISRFLARATDHMLVAHKSEKGRDNLIRKLISSSLDRYLCWKWW